MAILHAVALNSKLGDKGVRAVSLHPGAIGTHLWREMDPAVVEQVFKAISMKTMEEGVATILVAAFDPAFGGEGEKVIYLEDCQVVKPAGFAADEEVAERLWKVSGVLWGKGLIGKETGLESRARTSRR